MKQSILPIFPILLALMLGMPFSHGQSLDKAKKYMGQGRYPDAAKLLRKEVRKDMGNTAAHEQLGFAYRKMQMYKEAEFHFEQAEALAGLSDAGYIAYSQVLVRNSKKREAQVQLEKFLKAQPESFVGKLMLHSITETGEWVNLPHAFEVRPVEGVNSEYSDFAPVVYNNGIAFTTERNQDLVTENGEDNSMPYLAVFYSEFMDMQGMAFSKPKSFLSKLSGDYHVGPVSIDTHNQLVYYSEVRSTLDRDDVSRLKTYVASIYKGKRLQNARLLDINSDSFSIAHPAISPNGTTLFFASDMPGSRGMDIYFIKHTEAGWTTPAPVAEINTPLNEVFPYVFDDTTLYFSSNGHPGYGGLDIYQSKYRNGAWSEPINLKAPVNTESDDFSITFQNKTRGYFSSDRHGGAGKDDIYQFVQLSEPQQYERVKVAGIFEYKKIPPEGVTLRLLDEQDNVLEVIQTDSLGNFVFTELPTNKDYRIEVADATPEMMAESKVYLLNDDGEKVLLLDRMNENQFAFTSLPKEKLQMLALLEEKDTELGSYEIFGQLYTELPRDHYYGIQLMLYDDEGNLVKSVFTDSLGIYELSQLAKNQLYTIRPGRDSTIYRTSIFVEDASGIREVTSEKNSLFLLEQIMTRKMAEAMTMVPTRGFVRYEDRPVPNIRLMLIDSNEQNLRAVKTDAEGFFNFGRVASNENFSVILPDSLASLPGSTVVYLIDKDGNTLLYAKPRTADMYAFKSLKPEEFDPSLMNLVDRELKGYEIYGQVFQKLPGDYHQGLEIVALDEEGNIIEVAQADAQGNFKFSKLRPDQHYTFQVDEKDASGLKVSIYDPYGNLLSSLRLDELAEYVYEKLQREEAALIALQENTEDDGINADLVGGQIYKKLPGDYKEGVLVYAINDEGEVIDSTYTDGSGNFRFERLSRDEDFTLQVMDSEDSEMNVAFTNFKGHIEGSALLDSTNKFVYSKIIVEAAGDLGRLDEQDTAANKVYGQVYEKLPGDYKTGVKVYALDENGNILDMAELDESGKFAFAKLSKEASYILKLEEQEGDISFALLDEKGNIVKEIEQDEKGEFQFSKLDREKYDLATIDQGDTKLDNEKYTVPKPTPKPKPRPKPAATSASNVLYYDYREFALSADDSAILESIATAMVSDQERYLRISSHIDPSEAQGEQSFSALRSIHIARYLNKNGVALDRLYIENLEAGKPSVDCTEGCTEEERAKNQRSELFLVSRSDLPPVADHILYYDFNQWLLPTDGGKAVFTLVRSLKADPALRVQLDGYTDAWGSATSNYRMSQLRAENVRNILITNGISPDRIDLQLHGETIPLGNCVLDYPCPVSERKQNRRVEIRLLNSPGERTE